MSEPRWGALLAGGVGSRLWPLSSPSHPKQVRDPDGRGASLVRRAVTRLTVGDDAPIALERLLVVAGASMAAAIRADLPELPPDNLLIEPDARGTLGAALLATAEVARRGGASLVLAPADHAVDDVAAFQRDLAQAWSFVDAGHLVIFGQEPLEPSSAFGYIVPGAAPRSVARFVEKPSRALATALIAAAAQWNSGVFAWSVVGLLAALAEVDPGLARSLSGAISGEPIQAWWPELPSIAIDRAVLERCPSRLAVIAGDWGWSDLGTWSGVGARLPLHPLGCALVADGAALGGGGHIVHAPGHTVVTVGVDDLVIVVDNGRVLVARRGDDDAIGEVAARISQSRSTPLEVP